MANINFLLAGSCAVVLSVFSRSSLGGRGQGIREVNEKVNLKKSAFCASASCVAKARLWQRSYSSGSRSERWGARREILGEISPSTRQVSGAINASAEQMLRLKSAGMFW